LPLLLRSWKPRTTAPGHAAALDGPNALLAYGDGLSLLPLAVPEFLATLPDKQVREFLPRWQKAQTQADDPVKRLVVDVLLEAAHRRLGQTALADEAGKRLTANPARADLLGDKDVAGLVQSQREMPLTLEALRQFTAMLH
jgi:hypothetical protein